jgi:hypothetical protein
MTASVMRASERYSLASSMSLDFDGNRCYILRFSCTYSVRFGFEPHGTDREIVRYYDPDAALESVLDTTHRAPLPELAPSSLVSARIGG